MAQEANVQSQRAAVALGLLMHKELHISHTDLHAGPSSWLQRDVAVHDGTGLVYFEVKLRGGKVEIFR